MKCKIKVSVAACRKWWARYPIRRWWKVVKAHVRSWSRRWRSWRRSLDPELVELDAYRAMKKIDAKLQEWPHAIPLLEAGLRASKATGQEDRWYSYAVRLRDYEQPDLGMKPAQTIPEDARQFVYNERMEEHYRIAFAMIRRTHYVSTAYFQRMFGWGYGHCAAIVDLLELRGVVGPHNGLGPREIKIAV